MVKLAKDLVVGDTITTRYLDKLGPGGEIRTQVRTITSVEHRPNARGTDVFIRVLFDQGGGATWKPYEELTVNEG